jgi:hypothetical protein
MQHHAAPPIDERRTHRTHALERLSLTGVTGSDTPKDKTRPSGLLPGFFLNSTNTRGPHPAPARTCRHGRSLRQSGKPPRTEAAGCCHDALEILLKIEPALVLQIRPCFRRFVRRAKWSKNLLFPR